jgi:hypothetical protein
VNKTLLLPFYFGSVNEEQRLAVERELLADPEALLDYLDLKRKIEAAQDISGPTPQLWARLNQKIRPYRKTVFSISVGAAIAASLLLVWLFLAKPAELQNETGPELLFDSNYEHSLSSGVL